jgi:hypothetical protein
MTTILDASGRVRYTINVSGEMKVVRDVGGRTLGFIKNGKTYDAAGKLVSHGEDISAILN